MFASLLLALASRFNIPDSEAVFQKNVPEAVYVYCVTQARPRTTRSDSQKHHRSDLIAETRAEGYVTVLRC